MGTVVLAGCTTTVDGRAARDDVAPPRDLAAVLPDAAEAGQAAGNPLADHGLPEVGGINVLPNGIRDDSAADPIECLGPVTPFMRVVYEVGDVRRAAWQEFSNYGRQQTVSSVNAGVVEFSSDVEAQRMFAAFVTRWKACEGTSVRTEVHDPGGTELYQKVTDVTVDGAVLTATVLNSDNQGGAIFPTERAVGLAADCVVDVDVAVTGGTQAQQRALRLARAMQAEVTRGR
ncbi:sensor domain-containing protein [Mycobacterium sp. shizuoka-1]|uniref:sensor domain-containing protein n=1 Tax=Mycobacterium sp. shizuoka-1 TaxID=2039281 RepID=UPI000C05EAD1|nr:sensor domain-containing protein [Mycobacterium sp. shizuoka-1]GAY17202.1 hypothetical protein MSZK_39280 [Mycobacterium sp. shizuoka-1]